MIRFLLALLSLLLVHGFLFSQDHVIRLSASDNKEIVFRIVYKSITLQSDRGIIKLTAAKYSILKNKMIRLFNPSKPDSGEYLKTADFIELKIISPDAFDRHYWLPDDLTGAKLLKEVCDKGNILLSTRKKKFI